MLRASAAWWAALTLLLSPTLGLAAHAVNVQPTNVQPTNVQPTNVQPTNVQPTNAQAANTQPTTTTTPISSATSDRGAQLQPPGGGAAGQGRFIRLPKSVLTWDANLRFRASGGVHLQNLQAGQTSRVRGVFQRLRLGNRFTTRQLQARLQLQISGAFGAKGPGEQPVPVGLQAGSIRWNLDAVPGLSAEIGRMALSFGSGRHIGRYDFHDAGNAYDGIRVRYAVEPWLQLDGLGVKLRRNSAQPDQERTLFGLYLVGRPFKPLTTDVYLLVLNDGSEADRADLQTMGLRLEWLEGTQFRLELEGSLQVGSRQPRGTLASRDHLASAFAAEVAFNGRLGVFMGVGLRAQQYSGDDGAEADTSRAWRPLYPDLVRHLGLLQLFAQSGIRQLGAWWRIGATSGLHLEIDVRVNDTMAGAQMPGFGGTKIGVVGQGWIPLGTELDFRLTWPVLVGSRLMIAGGMFTPSQQLAAKLGDRLSRQLLVQWTSAF